MSATFIHLRRFAHNFVFERSLNKRHYENRLGTYDFLYTVSILFVKKKINACKSVCSDTPPTGAGGIFGYKRKPAWALRAAAASTDGSLEFYEAE